MHPIVKMNLTKFKVVHTGSVLCNMWRTTIMRSRSMDHTKDSVKTNKSTELTIDAAEVKHFSNFKNAWWDSDTFKALHAMNTLRVPFVRDGLLNTGFVETHPALPLKGIKLIDVGCGGGILTEALARIGAEVTGIDASSELITIAMEHAKQDSSLSKNLNYVCTTAEDLVQTEAEKYDVVVSSEVIEHVNNQTLFLESCAKLLKPGGSLFLTTINKTFLSWLIGIVTAEYVLRLLPVGTHAWDKFISPSDVQCVLDRHGCKTRLVHGFSYNPITNTWFWMSGTPINYAIHAVKQQKL